MSLFTQFAMNALISSSHPVINRSMCWNVRPHPGRCSLCKDICPKGEEIFLRVPGRVDFTACVDCGLCVSVCPTRCLYPSKEQVERDSLPADGRAETVWIGCEKSQRQNDVVRECISALSWEQLAFLALNKRLVLDLTPCGECENEACANQLQKVLRRLVDFFGEAAFNLRFALAYQPEEHPYTVQQLSRREAMSYATDRSKNGTRKLLKTLPGMGGQESDSHEYDFRLLLHERTKLIKNASNGAVRFGLYLPQVNEKCYGCGRCATACKPGAIQFTTGDDGIMKFIITPWKCSECGHCTTLCHTVGGMEGMKRYELTSLGPVILWKLRPQICTECGKPMPIDPEKTICHTCEIRMKAAQRREEARARVAAHKAKKAAEEAAKAAEAAAAAAVVENGAETGEAAPAVTENAPAVQTQNTETNAAPAVAVVDTNAATACETQTATAAEDGGAGAPVPQNPESTPAGSNAAPADNTPAGEVQTSAALAENSAAAPMNANAGETAPAPQTEPPATPPQNPEPPATEEA